MENAVYIVAAKRTPFGSFNGTLASVAAPRLGGYAFAAAAQAAGIDPAAWNELFCGSVLGAGLGQSPASQVAYHAGLRASLPCTLVNKVCASGTKAIMLGAESIRAGLNELVLAGGTENMSAVPHYLLNYRTGVKYGNAPLLDGLVRDGLTDPYTAKLMGDSAELMAEKYGITREAQDEYTVRSYQLAHKAQKEGALAEELVFVPIESRKGTVYVGEDEEPARVDFAKIPSLKPVFKAQGGTITAANASKINDGAVALALASEDAVKTHGLKPLARIVAFADAARHYEWWTVAVADALQLSFQKAKLSASDIDLYEINEAFSIVPLVNMQILDIPLEKMNVLGGAIAFGHPLGSSGARIVVSLLNGLKLHNKKYGAVGICNGGGGASAIIVENLS